MLHISQVPFVCSGCICGRTAGPIVHAHAMPGVSIWHERTRVWQSPSADSRPVHPPAGRPCSSIFSHAPHVRHPVSSFASSRQTRRRISVRVGATSSGGGNDGRDSDTAPLLPERWKLYAALIAVATVVATLLTYGGDSIQVHCLMMIPLHRISVSRVVCSPGVSATKSCISHSIKAGGLAASCCRLNATSTGGWSPAGCPVR